MNIIDLRGFWLKTISYGDCPNDGVILELYTNGNNLTSVDHLVCFFYRFRFLYIEDNLVARGSCLRLVSLSMELLIF